MWKSKDEQRRRELQGELALLEAQRREAINRVADALTRTGYFSGVSTSTVEQFIAQADSLRDALEPFDSGVRVTRAPEVKIEMPMFAHGIPVAPPPYYPAGD